MNMFRPPADLIMRPSDQQPGIYETDDEDRVPVMVVRHTDSKAYEMIWCDSGEGEKLVQPGDILLKNAYPMSYTAKYEKDGVMTEVPFDPGNLHYGKLL